MLKLADALAPFRGSYSPAFLDAMRFVLAWETSFEDGHADDYSHVSTENVSGDSGGRTRYGIDQANHPNVAVSKLTLAGALSIYHAGEWAEVQGDAQPLPALALAVFDASINVGRERAVRWLQTAAGVPADKRDGDLGPGTLGCENAWLAAHPAKHGADMLLAVQNARAAYYRSIATGSRRKFLNGWMNRTNTLSHVLGVA